MSRPVSDAAQKKGGECFHPIWREVGTTIIVSVAGASGKVGMT
jgi:hypothetical protein